ncbi:MAG: Hsp33 family molecular chaperone HslO [Clostridiales bacterium]|nr:MAG: Hsp33 family molecular chaperone HslO [Clostridiales bacterium]
MKKHSFPSEKDELEDIIKNDKKAEIKCHFCDKVYNFDENDLKNSA